MTRSSAIDAAIISADAADGDDTVFAAGTALQVLTLGLGSEIFAVETDIVHEVLDLVPITRVPNSSEFLPGLINVRGRVVPLADLRRKFGMSAGILTADSRIIVLEVMVDGEVTVVGTLADRVYEVTEVAAASMEEVPQYGMRWRPEFIKGIGKTEGGFIIIVDIDRIFASRQIVLQDAGALPIGGGMANIKTSKRGGAHDDGT